MEMIRVLKYFIVYMFLILDSIVKEINAFSLNFYNLWGGLCTVTGRHSAEMMTITLVQITCVNILPRHIYLSLHTRHLQTRYLGNLLDPHWYLMFDYFH